MDRQEISKLSQEMRNEVAAFKASGLSVRTFCENKPYTFHKFNYWALKLKKEDSGQYGSSKKGFSTLKPSKATVFASNSPSVEITFPNGIQVALYESVTANFLKSLL